MIDRLLHDAVKDGYWLKIFANGKLIYSGNDASLAWENILPMKEGAIEMHKRGVNVECMLISRTLFDEPKITILGKKDDPKCWLTYWAKVHLKGEKTHGYYRTQS